MIKILTIVGARPQIIKASAISRAINGKYKQQIEELIIHSGQHYDENMSDIFFQEMGIPKPVVNLKVGSSSHANQTAQIMEGVEQIILNEKPNAVLIYGDTNSTLATALAASKIHVPVIHVEAGLRSFNKSMPEEINRIMSDHVSSLLFCPTKTAIDNLAHEGFDLQNDHKATIDHPCVYHCGDIMYDNSLYFSDVSAQKSKILHDLAIVPNEFILITIHRNNNTDQADRLSAIFEALITIQLKTKLSLILPLHPRTQKMMHEVLSDELLDRIKDNLNLKIIAPAGFMDIIALEKNARLIITDSGGLQKEAFFFEKPCVILRPETEWIEIVDNGNALLADADYDRIVNATDLLLNKTDYSFPSLFGDGKAAEFIVEKMIEALSC